MAFGIIYKVTNLITDKCYIGQTTRKLSERINEHLYDVKRNNLYFHNSLRKYGKDNFKWEILCECSFRNELDEMEKYYIKELNTRSPNGYNLNSGGNGNSGYIMSDETKKKLSKINTGKKLSDETKKKIGDKSKGKRHTDETKKKLSEQRSGKNNPFYGKCHSDETKRKMSKSRKGKNNPMYGIKRIGKENPNSKKYIVTYDGKEEVIICLSEWCRKNNFKYDNIRYYIKNNKSYKGYLIRKL